VNYYNENDRDAASWLRQLIEMGAIPKGDVDTRSIEDVTPDDLGFYDQCHFFAGIGGWSYALSLAGVPSNYPLWTGSCPCQPFSTAGKRTGSDDERHLWPAFHWLIQQCRPGIVFGEQVASVDGLRWWDGVATDLEGISYTCAAVDLPAAGVGAPHIRSRLFWVAHPETAERESAGSPRQWGARPANGGGMGYLFSNGLQGHIEILEEPGQGTPLEGAVPTCGMGYPQSAGSEASPTERGKHRLTGPTGSPATSSWAGSEWIHCGDGKLRPVKPGVFPLADGIPGDLVCGGDSVPQADQSQESRALRLKGYGNAIVPQVAARFIEAALCGR